MIAKRTDETLAVPAPDPCYQIGTMRVSIRSDLAEAAEDFATLYREQRDDDAGDGVVISMAATAGPHALLGGRRYAISGDEQVLFRGRRPNEVLPYLEWGINWRVIATRADYLQIHAATLTYGAQGVILAGPSGSGKSTLAAGLIARGWSYLSDEFALLDPRTLHIHPFPKALCIKSGSFNVIERLGLPLWRRRPYVKAFKGRVGYISPADVGSCVETQPRPVRLIVFPRYTPGAAVRVCNVPRAQAAIALAGYAFNRNAHGARTFAVISKVVRGAACLGLTAGSLDAACDLMEACVRVGARACRLYNWGVRRRGLICRARPAGAIADTQVSRSSR